MADFVQMMKDWKRMCNAMGQEDEYTACAKCDLRDFGCPAIYEKECDSADWKHVENVVAKWVAEHPEPVYPSWGEWLEKQGIVKLVNSDRYEEDGRKVYMLLENIDNQIPADIAQKLEIEPKEGAC